MDTQPVKHVPPNFTSKLMNAYPTLIHLMDVFFTNILRVLKNFIVLLVEMDSY